MAERVRGARPFALGCLLMIPGFFGGGMIAVGVAKIVGALRRCTPPDGFPACDTPTYLWVGALIGLVLLPSVVVWRLRRGDGATRNSERS
ncbi:MAG TPA: hypothetical protein VFS44_02615 [Gemmatimonadaceae bacterium]|nr:hypothetical protein [Gemmatimonadaceae bacterium]